MQNPFEPPAQGVAPTQQPPRQSGLLGKMLSFAFASGAGLAGLIAVAGLFMEATGDGIDTDDIIVATTLAITLPLWLLASRDFWQGRTRAWLFVLSPFALFFIAAVIAGLADV